MVNAHQVAGSDVSGYAGYTGPRALVLRVGVRVPGAPVGDQVRVRVPGAPVGDQVRVRVPGAPVGWPG